MPNSEPAPIRGMIDKHQLLELVPLSYKTIWTLMRDGKFPKGVYLTRGKCAWFVDEIKSWMEDRSEHHRQVPKGDPPAEKVKRHAPPLKQSKED